MVHTAVVLPRDLLERLKRDAEISERGLSTEIRQRLKLTYDLEGLPRDPETVDLIDAIKLLADNLAGDLGKKWHQRRYVLTAFKNGIVWFLEQCQPNGDEGTRPDTRVVGDPNDPPEAVGRIHARLIWNARRGSG